MAGAPRRIRWGRPIAVALVLLGPVIGGCAGPRVEAAAGDGAPRRDCAVDPSSLVRPGRLTVGHPDPIAPWFADGDPANARGMDAALVYALAGRLGFGRHEVVWVEHAAEGATAPDRPTVDLHIGGVLAEEAAVASVPATEPYVRANEALVGFPDSPAAAARSLDDLRFLRLGADEGSPSLAFLEEVVRPAHPPMAFASRADAAVALQSGLVHAYVLDLREASRVVARELLGSGVIGQFEPSPTDPGLVITTPAGDDLRDCVQWALRGLRDAGVLDELSRDWLVDEPRRPEIPLE